MAAQAMAAGSSLHLGAYLVGTRGQRQVTIIRAQQQHKQLVSDDLLVPEKTSHIAANRRGLLTASAAAAALLAAAGSVILAPAAVLAEAKPIKLGPPPPPSGGLPGTLNADQPRDLELPLKLRFYLQPLPPSEAAQRAKESALDILNVKSLIEKKEWPYVQNDLRLKASYLRYDLNTVISAKPKQDKEPLKYLTDKLFASIGELDHAAKIKSIPAAEKYYAETKSILDDVLAKLG